MEIDNNFKYFLIDEDINIIIFATLMIFTIYFLRLYFKKKYKTGYLSYFNSNRFSVIKNATISIIILLIVGLNFILSTNETLISLGFEADITLLFLIPFVLIYKERLPQNNTLQGVAYTVSFTLANSISYIMLIGYFLFARYFQLVINFNIILF